MRLPEHVSVNGYRRDQRFAICLHRLGKHRGMTTSERKTNSPEWSEARAREAISGQLSVQGGLLPALHALQAAFGFIPEPAIGLLALEFNLSRAEVHGVATFYHDFRRGGPAGRHVL